MTKKAHELVAGDKITLKGSKVKCYVVALDSTKSALRLCMGRADGKCEFKWFKTDTLEFRYLGNGPESTNKYFYDEDNNITYVIHPGETKDANYLPASVDIYRNRVNSNTSKYEFHPVKNPIPTSSSSSAAAASAMTPPALRISSAGAAATSAGLAASSYSATRFVETALGRAQRQLVHPTPLFLGAMASTTPYAPQQAPLPVFFPPPQMLFQAPQFRQQAAPEAKRARLADLTRVHEELKQEREWKSRELDALRLKEAEATRQLITDAKSTIDRELTGFLDELPKAMTRFQAAASSLTTLLNGKLTNIHDAIRLVPAVELEQTHATVKQMITLIDTATTAMQLQFNESRAKTQAIREALLHATASSAAAPSAASSSFRPS